MFQPVFRYFLHEIISMIIARKIMACKGMDMISMIPWGAVRIWSFENR